MGKHINITNSKMLENIDRLKSHHQIFQTTKLLGYFIEKELENIENSKDTKISNISPNITKKPNLRWSDSIDRMCDMDSTDRAGTPEHIEDPETGDIVFNPLYNAFL